MNVFDISNRHYQVIAVKHDEVSLFADFEGTQRIATPSTPSIIPSAFA